MMSLWDALRMNMMISYQELVRTFPKKLKPHELAKLLCKAGLTKNFVDVRLFSCELAPEIPDSRCILK
ncbi:hypothetical protein ACQ9AQ_26040, partial [Escherichia coli]